LQAPNQYQTMILFTAVKKVDPGLRRWKKKIDRQDCRIHQNKALPIRIDSFLTPTSFIFTLISFVPSPVGLHMGALIAKAFSVQPACEL
jgi:hypothetical protein